MSVAQRRQGFILIGKSGQIGQDDEQLRQKAATEPDVAELLRQTDVLVDGPFIEAQRDLDLEWRGSANQRVLELKDGFIV